MKFTVRMFATTRDGFQFIHKVVELPDGLWADLMAWASHNRQRLIDAKTSEDADRLGSTTAIYATYSDVCRSMPVALAQSPDVQAAIAHFFNLAIDNPEMLPVVAHAKEGDRTEAVEAQKPC